MDVGFEVVAGALSPADAEAFRALFESAFPPEEREETDDLLAAIARDEQSCLIARMGDALVGFSVFMRLVSVDVVYLEYMATAERLRGRGIGSRLLAATTAHVRRVHPFARGVIFEVEPPDRAGNVAEQLLRARRIGFYQRAGAAIIEAAPRYEAPGLTGGAPVPFTLMWLPLTAPVPAGAVLRSCVEALLTEGYALDAADDLVARNRRTVQDG